MDRARVIVFYNTLWSRAVRPSLSSTRGNLMPLARYAWYLWTGYRTRGRNPIVTGVYRTLPKPPWSHWAGDQVSVLETLARSHYRDKLVHVTSRHVAKADQAPAPGARRSGPVGGRTRRTRSSIQGNVRV